MSTADSSTAAAAPAPLDAPASCLRPLPEHTAASPCPDAVPAAACRFAQATELFRRHDYPAAAEQFIQLSRNDIGDLGRASGENALVCIASLMRDGKRPGCRPLYETIALEIMARHCPLPQSASDRDCHTIHRLHFNVRKGLLLHDYERSRMSDAAQTATAMVQLFERYCTAGAPFNNAHQDPVAAGCDEVLSNAYRLSLHRGATQEAEHLRQLFLDPANRLGSSPYARDFATPSGSQPSQP